MPGAASTQEGSPMPQAQYSNLLMTFNIFLFMYFFYS